MQSVKSPPTANTKGTSLPTPSSNSFTVLSERSAEEEKENIPPKKSRNPTFKVAKAIEKEVKAVSKNFKVSPKGKSKYKK